jgi:hypothetical protein
MAAQFKSVRDEDVNTTSWITQISLRSFQYSTILTKLLLIQLVKSREQSTDFHLYYEALMSEEIGHNCGLCVTHWLGDTYLFIQSLKLRREKATGIVLTGIIVNFSPFYSAQK